MDVCGPHSAGTIYNQAVSSTDFLLTRVAMTVIPFSLAPYASAFASTSDPKAPHEAKASAIGRYNRVTYSLFLVVTTLMGVSIALVTHSLGQTSSPL